MLKMYRGSFNEIAVNFCGIKDWRTTWRISVYFIIHEYTTVLWFIIQLYILCYSRIVPGNACYNQRLSLYYTTHAVKICICSWLTADKLNEFRFEVTETKHKCVNAELSISQTDSDFFTIFKSTGCGQRRGGGVKFRHCDFESCRLDSFS